MANFDGASDPVPVSDDEEGSRISQDSISQNNEDETNDRITPNSSEMSPAELVCNDRVYSASTSSLVQEEEERQIDNVSLENGENEEGSENIKNQEHVKNVNDSDKAFDMDNSNTTSFRKTNGANTKLSPFKDIDNEEHNNDIENVSASPSGSPRECIDEVIVGKEMNEYIEVNKINWAELEGVNDLWAICDAVSAAHSGLPDSLLKESFLIVLEGHRAKNWNNWTRQQLDFLIGLWKKEVQNDKFIDRPTRFIASTTEYTTPVIIKTKRQTNAEKKKAQLRRLMGVGEMLEQARVKFATEEGEFDVEEDEHGNYTIGGQELSFETWGEINKIEEDDIVHYPVPPPKPKRPRKVNGKQRAQQSNLQFPQAHGFAPSSSVFEQPAIGLSPSATVSSSAAVSRPDIPKTNEHEKESKKQPKPEKDEGELSESDDDHTDSSSSSGSEDLQSASAVARHRRKRRREHERQRGQASVSNKSNGGMSEARQQQITQLMVNFMGGGGGQSSSTKYNS